MRIGLSYDSKEEYLAAGYSALEVMELDDEGVITGLEEALTSLGHRVERIGRGQELARRLVSGDRWDLVFNIAEGMVGRGREAQVPALCELFGQPITFSDSVTCALTLDKGLAKRVVRDSGIPTAPFAVVRTEADAELVTLSAPLFVKPLAEGSSKGVTGHSLVERREELAARCQELLAVFPSGLLVERFLPGREVTVGVVGNGSAATVVGVMEVIFTANAETAAYTALNKEEYKQRIDYRVLGDDQLGTQAAQMGLDCYRALECRDAARVDLRCDEADRLGFLEVNPLPGLHPVRSDLPIMARLNGLEYPQLLGRIVDGAAARYGL